MDERRSQVIELRCFGGLTVEETATVLKVSPDTVMRALRVADRRYIREQHAAFGGPQPPPLDHDGINDIYVEKASVVWYWYRGKWLHLQGAD